MRGHHAAAKSVPVSGFVSRKIVSATPQQSLSGPISRDTAILSLRYPISRDTFPGRLALPQNGAIHPPWYLVSQRHICALCVQYPVLQHIAR